MSVSTSIRTSLASPERRLSTRSRGRAIYFHGRHAELDAFRGLLLDVKRERGGTTFLIQGPPGAGKTALLYECEELARQVGWGVARIRPGALGNRGELASALGKSYVTKKTRHIGVDGHIGSNGQLAGYLRGAWGRSLEFAGKSVNEILRRVAKRRGLVLIMDEAQHLQIGIGTESSIKRAIVKSLDDIHNGTVGAPVILLAGGLGTSADVFEEFGVSRFDDECLWRLGTLDEGSARLVFRDWLTKSGGAPEDHKHLGCWINTLAQESQYWPQHIQLYARTAAQWVLDNGSVLQPQVPARVMSVGRSKREDYYSRRIRGIRLEGIVALANLLARNAEDYHLTQKEIESEFPESLPSDQAGVTLKLLLRKGVLADTPQKRFRVPIPSMRKWLVGEFADQPAL